MARNTASAGVEVGCTVRRLSDGVEWTVKGVERFGIAIRRELTRRFDTGEGLLLSEGEIPKVGDVLTLVDAELVDET